MPSEKILRERMKYFVLGFLEGILYTREASTRQTTCLKNITYVEIGWIGQKRIRPENKPTWS
jgi:hypothetical protein